MSFSSFKRPTYAQQRSASSGAAITLISYPGEYRAEFECATRCAEILGDRALTDLGDGILDNIPCFRIPTEDLFSALTKLSQRFSIALVEYTLTRNGGMFVCLWRINPLPALGTNLGSYQPQPASANVDDY